MQIFYDKKGRMQTVVLVAVIFTVLAGMGLFLFFPKMPSGVKPIKINNNTNSANNIPASNKIAEPENPALRDNCVNLSKNLESCSAYKCMYVYEKDGRELIGEVIGLVADNCHYKEQTRNLGMNLDCIFSSSTRKAVADFYTDLKLYDPENKTGEPIMSDVKIYSVDGKNVSDPMIEALLNGECQIDR